MPTLLINTQTEFLQFVLSKIALRLIGAVAIGLSPFGSAASSLAQESFDFDRGKVFDEVAQAVAEHFYDKNFDGDDWRERCSKLRKQATNAESFDQYDQLVNKLLATLNTSHTYYFSRNNPKRYQLFGIFHELYKDDEDLFCYDGIGIDTRIVDGKTFVVSVFDGLPAFKSGLKFGDEIVSVDGAPFHPIGSFAKKTGSSVTVKLNRAEKPMSLEIEVDQLDGRTMYETALEASARVIERGEKKIAYIHVWSYAGSKYQEKVREALLWGQLSECDALVFDCRDGWGGADLNYLNLFRDPIAIVQSEPRSGKSISYSGVWEKPVALLVNDRSTSGKELFTHGFKKLKLGKVFGETTAGAVVAGRIFRLSNGDALYLAVSDVHIDNQRLEGIGVEPDEKVKRPLKNAAANDQQLEAALDYLQRLRSSR